MPHYCNQAPDELADDYDELLKFLAEGFTKDIQKVRSIFIWMANQNIKAGDFHDVPESDTPRGFMKRVNEGHDTFATFFAVLCR